MWWGWCPAHLGNSPSSIAQTRDLHPDRRVSQRSQRRNPRRRTHPPRGIRSLVSPEPNELCPLCLPRNHPCKHPTCGCINSRPLPPSSYPSNTDRDSLLEFFHFMDDHATAKYPMLGSHRPQSRTNAPCAFTPHILTISPTVTRQLEKRAKNAQFHLVYTGVDQICFDAPWSEQDYILYFGRMTSTTKASTSSYPPLPNSTHPTSASSSQVAEPRKANAKYDLSPTISTSQTASNLPAPSHPEQKNTLMGPCPLRLHPLALRRLGHCRH